MAARKKAADNGDDTGKIDALINALSQAKTSVTAANTINAQMEQATNTVEAYKTVVTGAMTDKNTNMPDELLVLLQKDAPKLQKKLDGASGKTSNDSDKK